MTNSSTSTSQDVQPVDVDAKKRELHGWQYWIVAALALSASVFHLYTAVFGLRSAMYQRSIHWLFMGGLMFLLYLVSKNRPKNRIDWWDWVFAGLLIAGCLNIILNWEVITMREGAPITSDIYWGTIMILLVLEGTRRAMGLPLPIMATIALAYAFLGPYFPGILSHGGFALDEIAPFQYLRTDGIFGVPLGVSASFIFLFVLFGAVLSVSGAGQFFIDLSIALTGKSRGGPAKAAVVASALMGTVSGSSVANTVTTGAFTIPLMKTAGYRSEFAGAIVAAASTGGQVMPPVMERLPIEEVRHFIASLIQAEELGVAVSEVLRSQAGTLKRLRRLKAEEHARKAPIKILFPMILFIFPSLFVVILGPAFLSIMETLAKK
ncbi:MAG: TRAP transporter large permease subunit [Aminobacterium colombiense]|jgi:TRAP transporter 4TM/12TM fusion protein|uniref:TRAP transporter large permease subunit n=1 Tax=Aminobacterium colombiense TaxID=81468 RepID=UPI003D97691D